ncbi:hypothetical protein QYE76_034822 [Lolium multiflorum]|uniref:Aspartic peptidase DDI1-type domain-containing protein n=1 Tax=Lolium multiflorum TaxID=4521 RepID=A0AAD8VLL6_LOLMU|nr:hypothetical protein QYE76_034822 [Lolium multiflorum]
MNALIKAREEKLEREASIPRKLEDGGEPIIKMKVNDFDCNALCDLGASISVMPKKIYDMLDLPPLKNCYLDVNLVDNVIKKPLGRIDNVRIMVNNNLVPIDFVVLDIECNASCPIILGRPFLRTVGAIIDMKEVCFFIPFALAPKKPLFPSSSSSSSELSYGSSSSRETPPDIRAPEEWDLEDHASSIWSEDDQSLTSGDEDLQFLAVGELESESEDDRFPWDGCPTSEEEEEEDDDDDDDSLEGYPPAKRLRMWWDDDSSDDEGGNERATGVATRSPSAAVPMRVPRMTTRAAMARRLGSTSIGLAVVADWSIDPSFVLPFLSNRLFLCKKSRLMKKFSNSILPI